MVHHHGRELWFGVLDGHKRTNVVENVCHSGGGRRIVGGGENSGGRRRAGAAALFLKWCVSIQHFIHDHSQSPPILKQSTNKQTNVRVIHGSKDHHNLSLTTVYPPPLPRALSTNNSGAK